MNARTAALVGSTILALAAGCASSEAGQPQPQPSSSDTSSAAATSLPARPADLSVAGVDPCALIPEDQRAALEIDQPPNSQPDGDSLIGGTGCGYSVAAWGAYGVVVSPTYTVADWITQTANHPEENTVTSIGGYPAVVTYASDQPGSCLVLVDIAADSVLYVPVTDRRDFTVQDGTVVCANAEKAAGVALTTLESLQK